MTAGKLLTAKPKSSMRMVKHVFILRPIISKLALPGWKILNLPTGLLKLTLKARTLEEAVL